MIGVLIDIISFTITLFHQSKLGTLLINHTFEDRESYRDE